MTALTAFKNWTRSLWDDGKAVSAWREHFENLRAELEAPENASAHRVLDAEVARQKAADDYGRAPSEANRIALEKATAAVSLANAQHVQNFGREDQGTAWRLERLADLDLLDRAIREAFAELEARHQAATESAEALASEAAIELQPLLAQVNRGFAVRREQLDYAAHCAKHSRHNRANQDKIEPAGVSAAHGALENALRS